MPYTAIQKGADRPIPWRDIEMLCTDADTDEESVVLARATAIAERISAEIDGQLVGLGYTLPFSPVPKVIEIISDKLVAYALYSRRIDAAVPESVTAERSRALTLLDRITRREIQLVQDAAPLVDAPPLISHADADRKFPMDRLDRMP